MTPRPLPDETARQRVRSELDHNFMVEAGAGTGKTRLLVDRIEALVASGRISLRNVVAITFTEKAAAELRVKIRERFEALLRVSPDNAGRFRTALEDLEIAHVSTIHAFAAELLRERPVEAGVDPSFTVADELNASLLRTEAWDQWLERQREGGQGALRDAIEFGVSLKQFRALGDVLLRHRDIVTQDLDRGAEPADPLTWLASAEPVIRSCIAEIATHCRDASDNGARDLRELEQRLDVLGRLHDTERRRSVLGGLKLKIGGNQGKWAKGALVGIRQRLAALADSLEILRSAHAHYLAAGAVNWLRGYIAEYQALKAREGILDFDDLLLSARNLLRGRHDVRIYFQDRFEAILVDEFQDTDPLQAEIIFFLGEDGARAAAWDQVRLRPGKLFLVGDPKQSIYAFRRADIEAYERAKEVLLETGHVVHITANFRSVEPIIDAVNQTFQGQMQRPPDGAYQPDYVALTRCPMTISPDGPVLILLYPNVPGDGDTDVATLRRQEAEVLAGFIRGAIDEAKWRVGQERQPARFGDVALLFRGMSDVPAYEEAFNRYEIPYRVTSSRTYYRREEIGWLLNVLHAVEHPTDPVAVWGALRSPVFGCSDKEIYEYAVGEAQGFDYRHPTAGTPGNVTSAFEILRELHKARLRMSVPCLIEHVLARTNALATFLLTPQGEQRAANLAKLISLARALEESGLLTFRAFVHWLRDMEEQAVDEAESPTVEEGDDVVRIMSIHAAKGLEFPIVVIPDLGRGPGGGADYLLVDRVRGTAAARVGKVGDWPVQTSDYDAFKTHHASREAAERLRVLYVAMTRARDGLVVPVFPKPAKDSLQQDLQRVIPVAPRFGEVHKGWLVTDGQQIPRVPGDTPPVRLRLPEGPTPEGEAAIQARQAWLGARENALRGAGTADPVRNPSDLVDHDALRSLQEEGVSLETEPGGRTLGTMVHAVLATIPLDRPDLADAFVAYFARQAGVDESVARRASVLVRTALSSQEVTDAPRDRVFREIPFASVDADGIAEGAIDMLVERPAGATVIDFKTDVVDGGRADVLLALYAPQLQKYLSVVRQTSKLDVTGYLSFLQSHQDSGPKPD